MVDPLAPDLPPDRAGGDHGVDIGEQVAFLITRVFEEFCDASHPLVCSGNTGP